jgi:hypothetical protein
VQFAPITPAGNKRKGWCCAGMQILFLLICFTSLISSTCVIPNWLCYCRSISVEAIPCVEAVAIMDQQVLTTLLPRKALCKPCSPPVCSWLMKWQASISQKWKKKLWCSIMHPECDVIMNMQMKCRDVALIMWCGLFLNDVIPLLVLTNLISP